MSLISSPTPLPFIFSVSLTFSLIILLSAQTFVPHFATLRSVSPTSYTPAYTLRGIFMQLFCLFSAKSVPQDYNVRAPQEHLGDATVVQYLSEADIVKPFVDVGTSESRPFQRPHA